MLLFSPTKLSIKPDYADEPERLTMLHMFNTNHAGVYLHLYVSNEGVLLSLSRDITIEWLPKGFPRHFNEAVDAVVKGGESERNFMGTSHAGIEVCGIIERFADGPDSEHFYRLSLQKGPEKKNSLSIKLRETELKQIQKVFAGYWTC